MTSQLPGPLPEGQWLVTTGQGKSQPKGLLKGNRIWEEMVESREDVGDVPKPKRTSGAWSPTCLFLS